MTRGSRPGSPARQQTGVGPGWDQGSSPLAPPSPSLVSSFTPVAGLCLACRKPIRRDGIRISGDCWSTQAHRACAGAVVEVLVG